MEAIENILTRRSVRKFSSRMVSDDEIKMILECGMSAPSAVNKREWHFIVVKDKNTISSMADINGSAANPLRGASFAVLACGDIDAAFEKARDFWIIDLSAAVENMLLASHAMGIGSVWLGTYPIEERVGKLKKLFSLPENIIPHSIIAFGYSEEDIDSERVSRYEEKKVHAEKW